MSVSVHAAIDDIPAAEWDALAGPRYPFLRHAFLSAAEASGSVCPDTGWTPAHLAMRDDEGGLRAAMPLYEKSHSWGEFVFDWAWANAYERAGLDYYPKLVSATPFTPATGPKLLLADTDDRAAADALIGSLPALARERGCSSVHIQFPTDAEHPLFEQAGFLLRRDCQFHWHNRGYTDFDAFLATFSAAKRKKARRDRRRVREAGVRFVRRSGRTMTEADWSRTYELISLTFLQRGSLPYFTPQFFIDFANACPDDILVVDAKLDGEIIAAAIFFVGEDTLYGRYWGSNRHVDALHFETCYYQGIDYCIEHGLARFEPGTQGEHKVSRGFVPTDTWSAHWLAHPAFSDAIADYLDAEAEHVRRYMRAVDDHIPYRRGDGD